LPAPATSPAAALRPWQIPPEAFGSQRLYRVTYSGPEGEGALRVTLRLVAPGRYQIQAVDPVGRALWSLDVANEDGLMIDHRRRTWCTFGGRFDPTATPLGPFPLLALPALLLGRVPAEPVHPADVGELPSGGDISFRDTAGRQWAAALDAAGGVASWALARREEPSVWWRRYDDWAILSDRERSVQVRWREVLREPLAGEPERLAAPAGYREAPCGAQETPEGD
jgi:hypothetical protein